MFHVASQAMISQPTGTDNLQVGALNLLTPFSPLDLTFSCHLLASSLQFTLWCHTDLLASYFTSSPDLHSSTPGEGAGQH